MDSIPLLNPLFDEYNLSERDRVRIRAALNIIKQKDKHTYLHSIRTTILSMAIAKHLGADPKPLLFASPKHDLGKKEVPIHILRKKVFGPEDHAVMRPHPISAFKSIEPQDAFSAHIIVRHHRHKYDPYPKVIPKGKNKLSHKEKLHANGYSKFLAIADVWDAMVNRRSGRIASNFTLGFLQETMVKELPKLKPLIVKLFKDNFFDSHLANYKNRRAGYWGEQMRGLIKKKSSPLPRTGARKLRRR